MKKHFFSSIAIIIIIAGAAIAQSKPKPILVAEIGAGGRSKAVSLPKIAANSPLVVRDGNFSLERSAFDILNRERSARGLAQLVWDESIAKVARLHSRNMANENFFSHRGPDGSTVDSRAEQLGVVRWSAIAENIAFLKGHNDPASFAIENWMASPSHRRNMLGNGWQRSAIGVAVGQDGAYYFTQVFISGV